MFKGKLAWIIGVIGLGLVIRIGFLLSTQGMPFFADESSYLYLALVWNRCSIYIDGLLFLWPPGFPFCLSLFLGAFGAGGVFLFKLFQVLLSGLIGLMVLKLTDKLFSWKTAKLASLIWCFHLPLIGYTHLLWPEIFYLSLFLPGLFFLVCWWEKAYNPSLVAAGFLIGLSLLFKEVGLWWCVLIFVLIVFRDKDRVWSLGLPRACVFILSAAVVVLPWSLRNYEVYGRAAPVGATLGQNVFLGMNNQYKNFDYPMLSQNAHMKNPLSRWLLQPSAPQWKRSSAINIIDQSSENLKKGLFYAKENPSHFLRTRIKRLADWATPMSFFLRHYRLGCYQGVLNHHLLRKILIVFALVSPMLILFGAIGGLFYSIPRTSAHHMILWTLFYFSATGALIAGMSRYRICVEPLLIMLTAAFLTGFHKTRSKKRIALFCVTSWSILLGLWAVNATVLFNTLSKIW